MSEQDNIIDAADKLPPDPAEFTDDVRLSWLIGATKVNLGECRASFDVPGRYLTKDEAMELMTLIAENAFCDRAVARIWAAVKSAELLGK